MEQPINSEMLAFLLDPAARDDPYPFFDRLRAEAPVYRTGFRSVMLTRWTDVEAALRDARLGFDRRSAAWRPYARSPIIDAYFNDMMSMRDGADHARLRSLLNGCFTTSRAGELRGKVTDLVRDAITTAAEPGHLDVVAELAADLPLDLACILLDIPAADRADVKKWGRTLTRQLLAYGQTAQDLEAAEKEAGCLAAYTLALAGDRDSGLLGNLASARDAGVITDGELVGCAMMLIISGTETGTHAISNAIAQIIEYDQVNLLHDRRDLIPAAVEEALRLESPVRLVARTALADLEIGGQPVYRDEVVIPVLAAANRDPRRYEDTNTFRYGRRNGHIAFGRGAHFCLGRAFGLMLAEIVVDELVTSFKVAAAFNRLAWSRSLVFRNLDELPITVVRR